MDSKPSLEMMIIKSSILLFSIGLGEYSVLLSELTILSTPPLSRLGSTLTL